MCSRFAVVGGVLCGLLAAACAGGAGERAVATPEPMEIATDIDPALLEPLEGLGECGDQPDAIADVDTVVGLYLPDGARVTKVVEQGPITSVEGWVPLTPIAVRADFVTRGDLDVISVEDEVWESETLVSDGEYRLFVKAQGICRTESIFVALISAEDGSAASPLGQEE